ncbi:MAG: PRC-barrel domain-containing protein [Verrucomicrobia bacterium]|nr:PRC-barrel domain-containing protein [Verrucomicrobiota bacterium]
MDIASLRDPANALIGKRVVDSQEEEEEIGTIDGVWLDPSTYSPEFVGIRAGWAFGKTHVMPAKLVDVGEDDQTVRLRCPASLVKAAPSVTPGNELSALDKERINAYYGVSVPAERVTDINDVRPGEGLNPAPSEPREEPASLALTEPPLPESEHTAAERAFPSDHALENLTNEAHGQ